MIGFERGLFLQRADLLLFEVNDGAEVVFELLLVVDVLRGGGELVEKQNLVENLDEVLVHELLGFLEFGEDLAVEVPILLDLFHQNLALFVDLFQEANDLRMLDVFQDVLDLADQVPVLVRDFLDVRSSFIDFFLSFSVQVVDFFALQLLTQIVAFLEELFFVQLGRGVVQRAL